MISWAGLRSTRIRLRGTFGNGDTSAHQPSESSDSSSTHNFGAVVVNVNKRSVSADARAFTPNYLLGVDLLNSNRTVER